MSTTIPDDLQRLARDLGVWLPLDPLDWDRVRARFLISLLQRLLSQQPEVAAAIDLHRRVLAGDRPSPAECAAADRAATRTVTRTVTGAADRAVAWVADLAGGHYDRAQRLDLLAAIKAEQAPPAPNPTIPDRLARAMCPSDYSDCPTPCRRCTDDARRITRELATILRERHGSSDTADWLDALYPHNP